MTLAAMAPVVEQRWFAISGLLSAALLAIVIAMTMKRRRSAA